MKNKRKRVRLQQRDIQLFDYLFRHRVAIAKVIHRDVFNDYKSLKCTRVRLNRLMKAGYIQAKYFNLESRDKCYRLTSSTVKRFIDFSKNAYIWKGTNSPNHDINLIDIWRSLKNREKIEYMLTEHEYNLRDNLKCTEARMNLGDLRPDGYLEIRIGGKSFKAALEYERSSKTKPRYLDMIDRYYRNKNIKAVFYISEHEGTQKQVQNAELEYRTRSQEPKFFYALRDNINENDTISFRSVGNKEYQIDFKLSVVSTDSKTTVSTKQITMQSIENIRKTIATKFFSENPSSPLCREYNNKPQTNINETGGLNGN